MMMMIVTDNDDGEFPLLEKTSEELPIDVKSLLN